VWCVCVCSRARANAEQVRKAVCSEGFEFRDNECRPVEGEGVELGRGAGRAGDLSQGLEGGKGEQVVERETEKPEL
jgi:hypothetical protein